MTLRLLFVHISFSLPPTSFLCNVSFIWPPVLSYIWPHTGSVQDYPGTLTPQGSLNLFLALKAVCRHPSALQPVAPTIHTPQPCTPQSLLFHKQVVSQRLVQRADSTSLTSTGGSLCPKHPSSPKIFLDILRLG